MKKESLQSLVVSAVVLTLLALAVLELFGLTGLDSREKTNEQPYDYDNKINITELYIENKSTKPFLTLKKDYSGIVSYPDEITIRTNSYGMRDTTFKPTTSEELRILVIGDSHTFGLGINQSYRYTDVLERHMKETYKEPVDILNAAVGGWGYKDYRAFLERFGESLEPDIIVIAYVPNDIMARELHNKFLNEARAKIDRNQYGSEQAYNKAINDYLKQNLDRREQAVIAESVKNIQKIHTISRDLDTTLLFYSLTPRNHHDKEVYDIIARLAENQNAVYDTVGPPVFLQRTKNVTQADEKHPNRKGHSLIADDLREKLEPIILQMTD